MGKNYRFYLSFVWTVLGIALCVCNAAGLVEDFWFSMGFALAIVGVLQGLRNIRYRTSEEYREKVDTESRDERNRFLAGKAWAWAGYLFVLACGCAVIVCRIIGQPQLSLAASYAVCLLMILYWGSFLVLRKKY